MSKLDGIVYYPIEGQSYLNISSNYGYRELIYKGKKYKGNHNGIDITNGLNIQSVESGKVIKVRNGIPGYDEVNSSGNYVIIEHGGGIITQYLHLKNNSIMVNVGDIVTKNQMIGIMGSTGFSTGRHLHFGMKKNNKYVNPCEYLIKENSIPPLSSNNNEDNVNVSGSTYIVKKGDTLSGIGKKFGISWKDIYELNKNKIGNNPNLIVTGTILTLPITTSNNTSTTYVVQKGDTLSGIGKKFGKNWRKIYEDNKSVIGSNPNLIRVGTKLIIK